MAAGLPLTATFDGRTQRSVDHLDNVNARSLIACGLLCCVYSTSAQTLTPEQNIIAQTLLGEARGRQSWFIFGGRDHQTPYRTKSFPSTATKVCLEHKQFDYWTQHPRAKWDDQNRANVRRLMQGNTELVRYAKMLAINIARIDTSYIKNADHYCTLDTHNYWTKGRKPVAVVGQHKFYKLR